VCLAVPAAVLALHAVLLPQGVWNDEFFEFGMFRQFGWQGFLYRLEHWSPRPVSEALFWLYWLAVYATSRPLVGPALLAAWGIAAGLLAAAAQPWRRPGRAARLALVLALPAAALLSGPVEELYYWPMGALAYLPAIGAAGCVTLRLAGPGLRHASDRVMVAGVLILGALSVEMGAFLALCCGPLLLAADRVAARAWRPLAAATSLAPVAVAFLVLVMLLFGRLTDTTTYGPPGAGHHPFGSLFLAAPVFLREMLVPDSAPLSAGALAASLLAKALFTGGAWAALGRAWPAPPPRLPLLALLGALAGTAYLSIAAAYYQFGAPCCERHASYRQALVLLMMVALAGMLPRRRPGPARRWPVAPLLLALALLPSLPPRLLALAGEYRLIPAREAARATTFATGWAPGPAPIRFVRPPSGPLLRHAYLPRGYYRLAGNPAWYLQGPMLFFGKDSMEVVDKP
jgi:hypothetical protein